MNNILNRPTTFLLKFEERTHQNDELELYNSR